jgi:serine phosphatase RsbU (regulator of sigma subunit)/CHASE3 domain sensor protein
VARIQGPFSLRGLLLWLATLEVFLLVAIAAFIGLQVREVRETTDLAVEIYEPAAENASELVLANSEMERGVSLYALGASEEDLAPFASGERQSDLALEALVKREATDEQVGRLIASVATAREQWLAAIARPAIKAVRKDDSATANAILTSDESLALYDDLESATAVLNNRIDQIRTTAFRDLASLTDQLVVLLAVSALTIVSSSFITLGVMFRWVLRPLNDLRRQIREAARRGHHHRPIHPTGPRELAAVGTDAESLRRQLVAEIDEARSAKQALAHRAPLVTAIRKELSMPTDPQVSGLDVYGEVIPAEGVLAGDWWDCVAISSSETVVTVADVSGHGPEAGIAAMRVKHLLAQSLASGAGLDESLELAARSFADEPGRFATAVVVSANADDGKLRWSNAGHHPPIVFSERGEYRELKCAGPLLSWLGGPRDVCESRIGPGEYLVCFSDGLIESHDKEGRELQTAGLVKMLQEVVATSPDPTELVKRVLARARERAVDWNRDDVTLVAVRLDRAA